MSGGSPVRTFGQSWVVRAPETAGYPACFAPGLPVPRCVRTFGQVRRGRRRAPSDSGERSPPRKSQGMAFVVPLPGGNSWGLLGDRYTPGPNQASGRGADLVARLNGVQEVAGSIPVAPTILPPPRGGRQWPQGPSSRGFAGTCGGLPLRSRGPRLCQRLPANDHACASLVQALVQAFAGHRCRSPQPPPGSSPHQGADREARRGPRRRPAASGRSRRSSSSRCCRGAWPPVRSGEPSHPSTAACQRCASAHVRRCSTHARRVSGCRPTPSRGSGSSPVPSGRRTGARPPRGVQGPGSPAALCSLPGAYK